jgi:hypothetical protein
MANTAAFLTILAALCATARSRSMLDIEGVEARATPTAPLSPRAARPGADPQFLKIVNPMSYGRYCGKGTVDFTAAAVDSLDACCVKHDRCFSGVNQACDMVGCNTALSNCVNAVRAKCSWTQLVTSAMCRATTNIKAYAWWETNIKCTAPNRSVYYKTDEELEIEACSGKAVKTKLSNNGVDYCKSADTNDYYCNEDYAEGCGEDYSCGTNEDGDYVCE